MASIFGQTSMALGLLAIVSSQAPVGMAQPVRADAERLDALTQAYAELRREDPQLEERSRERIARDVREIFRARRERMPRTSTVTGRATGGSVAASARCEEGYIVEANHSVSDQSVSIVSEKMRDCDGDGCRAYEVRAVSETTESFELDVSVTCAG